MIRPRRRAAPSLSPVHEPGSGAAILAAVGAVDFELMPGYWCYVLFEDGARTRPFYVGMSGSAIARIGTHTENHGARLAAVSVVPCRDEHQARVTQLMLIDRLEGDLINVLGTAQYERYRTQARQRAKYLDSPEQVARTMRPDRLPA